jgi:acid phosphatase family membrane protein YuiD
MRTDQINVILLIALISWGTAQILKTLIHFIKTKNFKAERLTVRAVCRQHIRLLYVRQQ